MRRYLYMGNWNKLEKQYCDVVIVGSGLAGLYAALNIDKSLSCIILSKGDKDQCSSYLAQGGIAAVISEDDKTELHYQDTLYAGAFLCNKEAVKILVHEGPKEIRRLESMGVPFDVDSNGEFYRTREGGHSKNRILHCGGDATGRGVVEALYDILKDRKNIQLQRHAFLVDIVTDEGKTIGVLIYNNGFKIIYSPNVVICSGGIGQLYISSTNPLTATGDGIAAAIRAGVEARNMEFVQFHPTALYQKSRTERAFLISESMRGEGGILRNLQGERFMCMRHPMAELAPRDVVAREIFREMKKSNAPYVYLDMTAKSKNYLVNRFPTIYDMCKQNGIDISKQLIPVCPVQHYLMGGIKTDLNGKTTIVGLYACGEVAYTGVHGANRLASNSLLECLVFGRRCAQQMNHSSNYGRKNTYGKDMDDIHQIQQDFEIDDLFRQGKKRIKEIMYSYGGIIRNQAGLEKGLSEIRHMIGKLEHVAFIKPEQMELYNMAMVANEILQAASKRRKSIGAHYREDDKRDGSEKSC